MDPGVTQSTAIQSTCGSVDKNLLTSWNFDAKILRYYMSKGITRFFDWQVEALLRPNVMQGGNLVYSAPTSAGKTMVADVLLFKHLLESKKKGIIILPFVSIALEKVNSLKSLFRQLGLQIESFAGNVNPRGGLDRVNVAVCTIEKANNMINRLIEENTLDKVGIIVVDELHMLGDDSRGYLLELLLTKLRFLAENQIADTPQIVGMSATIPNLSDVAKWLKAELYVTEYRPVPLYERLVLDNNIFDSQFADRLQVSTSFGPASASTTGQLEPLDTINPSDLDLESEKEANIIYLTIETITLGYSCLVFCSTKAHCEALAKNIAKNIFEIGGRKKSKGDPNKLQECSQKLRAAFDYVKIKELLDSLKRCSTGLDSNLELAIRFGVAFHHAGLSTEERALVEHAFRKGTLRVLCSTTTLSAGVNLPARRVMICSAFDYRKSPLDATSYRQMIGRAGRKGIDTLGEAMLFTNQGDFPKAKQVVKSSMQPVKSSLANYHVETISSPIKRATPDDECDSTSSSSTMYAQLMKTNRIKISEPMRRATLEAIVDGLVNSVDDLVNYFRCTFFFHSTKNNSSQVKKAIEEAIECLKSLELVYNENVTAPLDRTLEASQPEEQADQPIFSGRFLASPFGRAVVASGVPPDQGTFLMTELDRARSNLCLMNDLHLVYLATPTYFHRQLEGLLSWSHYYQLFQHMNKDMKKVAEVVGIEEGYIVRRVACQLSSDECHIRHTRFFVSLALFDLVQEVPLMRVAQDYNLTKGMVQSLQQQAAQFAGMLTVFCNRLGWVYLEMLIGEIQKRLSFGVQRELIDLMRIPFLTSQLARQLYDQKFETVVSLVNVETKDVEKALITSTPFVKRDATGHGIAAPEGTSINPAKATVFVPNLDKHVSIRRLAHMIIREAKRIIETDIGHPMFPAEEYESGSGDDDELEVDTNPL